jgi:hypothetical protein
MEAIALGIAIGAGAVLALKNGRARAKLVVGWASRQAGWISGQVNTAIEATRRVARDEYSRGREENLAKIAEMPPLSVRASVPPDTSAPAVQAHGTNGTNGTNGTTYPS